ncbi:hypothetical protein ACLIBG_02165 [Virgibacillus sp. W0181]|uniref:hypothetical protein n=1 Tax=Virgibacillus sp. W0181 TaxID=3391581 RepID=UPI003F45122A
MKKRHIASIGAVSVAAGLWLKNKRKNNNKRSTLEQAGKPDQIESEDHAQLENAKMVSEGSQFGVQYYNEAKEAKDLHKKLK